MNLFTIQLQELYLALLYLALMLLVTHSVHGHIPIKVYVLPRLWWAVLGDLILSD